MGQLTLPSSGDVYVDANTVIYGVERVEPYSSLLTPLWTSAQQSQVTLVTSELTWLETLAKPLRVGDTTLERLYRLFLTGKEVRLVPANLGVWDQAAHLRGLGLKTPDALHAATSLATNRAMFLTNDAIFTRVPALPVTLLSAVLAAPN